MIASVRCIHSARAGDAAAARASSAYSAYGAYSAPAGRLLIDARPLRLQTMEAKGTTAYACRLAVALFSQHATIRNPDEVAYETRASQRSHGWHAGGRAARRAGTGAGAG